MKIKNLSSLIKDGIAQNWHSSSVCYGHFDVIHPGHQRYFQTARKHGNPLIIAVEGDVTLQKIGARIAYSQTERAQGVASIDVVDQVVVLDTGNLEVLVDLVEPSALVLGREFERERLYEVKEAVAKLEQIGGKLIYDVGETHSAATDLFSKNIDELEKLRWQQFQTTLASRSVDLKKVVSEISSSRSCKILVIGDTIVDRFVACDPVGMSNEAPVVVVKEIDQRDFIGGAGIVAAHVAALGADSIYLSVVGGDVRADFVRRKLNEFSVQDYLYKDSSRPTTNKIRYMVENQKLFRVSQLKEHAVPTDVENKLCNKICELAPTLDAIVVCDFVYGVVTGRIIDQVNRASKQYGMPVLGDLQCSSQIGDISKFKGFSLLSPTEREARIAMGNNNDSVEYVANALLKRTRASHMILKMGAEGVIAYSKSGESDYFDRQHFPALSVNPVDVAGAGDSMLAGVSVAMARGCSLMEATAIGTLMGAISVNSVGNVPISYQSLVNYTHQILSYPET